MSLCFRFSNLILPGLLLALLSGCHEARLDPTIMLISLDGFRWDYPEKADTPNLDRLARSGVRAEGLIPVFPTKTFPSHYSIVTGLYAESHGIVGNNMYDAGLDSKFSLSNREAVGDGRWWGGEPIWVTAAKQGKKSATLFWPGSEARIKGYRPTYWMKYDEEMPYRQRIRQVLEWLELPPEDRPTFISLYFARADTVGHRYGPESEQLKEAVGNLDRTLGHLLEGLDSRLLTSKVDLLIVSDHGMTPLSQDRVIFLDEYINLSQVQMVEWSPVAAIRPRGSATGSVYEALKNAHPHMKVYLKDEIPDRLHYRNNPRIAPIIAIADEGWTITDRSYFERRQGRLSAATHGFDNQLKSMQGIFIAHGPSFRKGITVPAFSCVQVYPLMTHILGLDPAPHEADLDGIRNMLVAEEK
jgi:predicted AlkP superfamily pyrophosphatase or phosphodiesterase